MAATNTLRQALNEGISTGSLVDTKIILYSHRDSSGRICRPKALYANSQVLNAVPYFNSLFSQRFPRVRSRGFSGDIIDNEESANDYGYLSDSDLEDDEDERIAPFKQKSKSKIHQFDPFGIPGEDREILCEEHAENPEHGRVVRIPDVAFVTFQAFLMYLYTGVIEFAPFGSKENRRSRSAEIVTPSDNEVPRPSPKSIYRLADKYNVPILKALAVNRIRSELEKCDIVEESFSRFASRYNEIKTLCTNRLGSVWTEDSTSDATRISVEKKLVGDLGHAAGVLAALWEIANKDGSTVSDTGTPSNPSPVAVNTGTGGRRKKKGKATNPTPSMGLPPEIPPAKSPAHWAFVKIALINSIRDGIFFDRKYWARHSKAGDILKPVYFSSIIMGDRAQQLRNLIRYLVGRNILVNDLEGGVNLDSDCEGGLTGTVGGTWKKGKDEENRAVLTVGSFSAWKSLFFYRCTDVILFAPLKSQGTGSRLSYIRARTVTTNPPPCSPKSIYVLAKLLEIEPLYESAFEDIKRKVSSNNIVDEVFSWVTASQDKIMEMQCELLISKFNNPETIALVKENIGRISDGSSSHCASALKLGLKKAFDLKKQNNQPLGVLLRCTWSGCAWYNNHASYSSVGSNTYCPHCGSYYMQCVGCGYNRTSNYASCQSCGKRFI